MHVPFAVHVVVVGGGILGASTAAHLIRAGARVTLLTAATFADGGIRAFAVLAQLLGERSRDYHYLRLLGLDRYRTWSAQHPDSARFLRFDGALKWALPGQSLRETFDRERSRGYDAVWLDRDAVAARLPDVRSEAVPDEGAIFNPR